MASMGVYDRPTLAGGTMAHWSHPRRGASVRTDNGGVLRLFAAFVVALTACQYMPTTPAIDCGELPPNECDRMVDALLEQARSEYPDKQVKSIRLSTPGGGDDVMFTDGTGFAVTH